MMEEFLNNLSVTFTQLAPVFILAISLALLVGWIERTNKQGLREKATKRRKENERKQ